MTEKILTLHPAGKTGTNIDKAKYEAIRDAIIAIVTEHEVISFTNLMEEVGRRLASSTSPFEGSIAWYTTTVKLDLEARRLIERIPSRSPQQLRFCKL